MFVILYVFTVPEGRNLKVACVIFIILVGAFSFNENLTEGRNIVKTVEIDDSFAALATDAGEDVRAIGATWDINWGDIALIKSVPDRLGYKVFLEGETSDLSPVDYVLTTRKYLDEHADLESRLEYMFTTKDSYLVYRVK